MATNDNLEYAIVKLPIEQQQEARDMIDSAHKLGWRSVGFWTDDDIVDITDLYGLHPVTNKGWFIAWELLNEE